MRFFNVNFEKSDSNLEHLRQQHNLIELKGVILRTHAESLCKCSNTLAYQSKLLNCQKGALQHWMKRNLDPEFAAMLKQKITSRPEVVQAQQKNLELITIATNHVDQAQSLRQTIEDVDRQIYARAEDLYTPRLSRSSKESQQQMLAKLQEDIENKIERPATDLISNMKSHVHQCGLAIEGNENLLAARFTPRPGNETGGDKPKRFRSWRQPFL